MNDQPNPYRHLLMTRFVLTILLGGSLVFLFASHGFAAPWVLSFALMVAIAHLVVRGMSMKRRLKFLRERANKPATDVRPSELATGIRRQRILLVGYSVGLGLWATACAVLATVFREFDPIGYVLAAIFGALIVASQIVSEVAIRRRLAKATGRTGSRLSESN